MPVLGQGFPHTLTINVAVGTIFNVFSYDAVLCRNSNLFDKRMRERVEPRSRVKGTLVQHSNSTLSLSLFSLSLFLPFYLSYLSLTKRSTTFLSYSTAVTLPLRN